MIRHSYTFLIVAAMTGLVTQCEKGPSTEVSASSSVVLATVAGQPITEADLREEAAWRMSNRRSMPVVADLLDEMIQRRALLAKARNEGIDGDPATRRRMEGILISELRGRELEKAVATAEITEDALREAYESRAGELSRKGQDRFAMLFLEASEKSSDEHRAEVRARLAEGIAKIDASPSPGGRGPAAIGFGAVAADYSDDQIGRYRGGDVGWLETGAGSSRVPEGILEVGRALEKGQRSEIIETPAGFYVIMKTDLRTGGMPPMEEISVKLHQQLLVEKRRTIEERFMANALEAAEVSIDTDALGKVTLPTSRKRSSSSQPPSGVPNPSAAR